MNITSSVYTTNYLIETFEPCQKKKAAITIQRFYRRIHEKEHVSLVSRSELYFLPKKLRSQVNNFLATTSKQSLKDIPRAQTGETDVYFPKEFPTIILKQSGQACCSRLQKMIMARDICITMNANYLVIPKALLNKVQMNKNVFMGNFLIEERLPLGSVKLFDQQQFYLENQTKVTPAIQELTHFLFRSGADDLICSNKHAPQNFILKPRYDNYPFFITKEGEIKIGLIDIEDMDKQKKPSLKTLFALVYMYAYHKDVIIEAAEKYFSPDELKREFNKIEEREKWGKAFIQVNCIDLQTYIKNKINPKIELLPEVEAKIINEFKEEINAAKSECSLTKNKNKGDITEEECKTISTALKKLCEALNRLKEKKREIDYHHFIFSIDQIEQPVFDTELSELEYTLFFPPRKILNGDGKTLIDYLMTKLEKHKVIYSSSLTSHGTFIA